MIVEIKCPEPTPYIIKEKFVLMYSASEKSLLDRMRVGRADSFSGKGQNSMIEGQIERHCHGRRSAAAPIKK